MTIRPLLPSALVFVSCTLSASAVQRVGTPPAQASGNTLSTNRSSDFTAYYSTTDSAPTIPPSLRWHLRTFLAEWRVLTLEDFTDEWHEYSRPKEHHSAICAGFFDDDYARDYALLLRNMTTRRVSLYAFHRRGDGYEHLRLAHEVTSAARLGARLKSETKGVYTCFREIPSGETVEYPMTTDSDSIHLIFFETASILYSWDGAAYRECWTSD